MSVKRPRTQRRRNTEARYKQKLYRRWRLKGLCVRCGAETGKRRPDGRPYSECRRHRLKSADTHRVAIRRRRRWARRGWVAPLCGGPRSSLL